MDGTVRAGGYPRVDRDHPQRALRRTDKRRIATFERPGGTPYTPKRFCQRTPATIAQRALKHQKTKNKKQKKGKPPSRDGDTLPSQMLRPTFGDRRPLSRQGGAVLGPWPSLRRSAVRPFLRRGRAGQTARRVSTAPAPRTRPAVPAAAHRMP